MKRCKRPYGHVSSYTFMLVNASNIFLPHEYGQCLRIVSACRTKTLIRLPNCKITALRTGRVLESGILCSRALFSECSASVFFQLIPVPVDNKRKPEKIDKKKRIQKMHRLMWVMTKSNSF